MRFEYEEERMFLAAEIEEINKKTEHKYHPGRGEWKIPRPAYLKVDDEEMDDIFDSIDMNTINDNVTTDDTGRMIINDDDYDAG